MSNIPSLQKLVTAIASSVLEAQEKIEAAQLVNLMSYFKRKPDKKGYFPLTMKLNLPSTRPEARPGETDVYQVPYLSVLPYSALRIKEVDVDFDVHFSGLDGREDEEESNRLARSGDLPDLAVDLGGLKSRDGFGAHVSLTLEGVELPEGTCRLINELIKSNQVYESPTPPPVIAGQPEARTKSPGQGTAAAKGAKTNLEDE